MNGWWEFVTQVTRGESQNGIARRLGMPASSVHRWQWSTPTPGTVRAFAHAYEVLVLDAMIAAGHLTEGDVDAVIEARLTA